MSARSCWTCSIDVRRRTPRTTGRPEQLSSEPGRVLAEALRHTDTQSVRRLSEPDRPAGARAAAAREEDHELLAEAEKLHKQLDRYAYGPPTIRFAEQDVDEARAAGVLIELERSASRSSSTGRCIASSRRAP